MSDLAIRVENLGKEYQIGVPAANYQTLRDRFSSMFQSRSKRLESRNAEPKGKIWALRDVSFDVKQGQVLGVIGRNGAG